MTKRTGAGTLRDRITVERRTPVSNGRGGTTDTWNAIATSIPASIAIEKGGEDIRSSRLTGVTPIDVLVRYTPSTASIQPSDRLRDANGAVYAVKWAGSLDEGRKRWMLITCERGTVANG